MFCRLQICQYFCCFKLPPPSHSLPFPQLGRCVHKACQSFPFYYLNLVKGRNYGADKETCPWVSWFGREWRFQALSAFLHSLGLPRKVLLFFFKKCHDVKTSSFPSLTTPVFNSGNWKMLIIRLNSTLHPNEADVLHLFPRLGNNGL